MKIQIEHPSYNVLLLPIEWRFSAATVGLIHFFQFIEEREGVKLYAYTKKKEANQYPIYNEISGYIQGLLYNSSDLTEERYLYFCEAYFQDEFPHKKVEILLQSKETFSEDDINYINSYLTGINSNTVMKKIFKGVKFDGNNRENIQMIIQTHRFELIKETFRFKTSLYRNFANTNKMLSDTNPHCRLLGYDMDENRKSKAASYFFDTATFIANDICEFDFIPFAFTHSLIGFFANNNSSISNLVKCNDYLNTIFSKKEEVVDNTIIEDRYQTKLIKALIASDDFSDFDVEIISKDRREEYYNTLVIRKNALQKLKKIYAHYNLRYMHKYNYNYWLNVEEELIDCCLNNNNLDNLLEQLLLLSRIESEYRTIQIIHPLIEINIEWKGAKSTMEETIKRAKNTGYHVGTIIREKNGENKVKGYKNKLINAIVSHDKDRVLEIMIQLSGYIEGEISCIYDIIDAKEHWSEIAISFTNAMIPYKKDNKEDK